MILVVGGTGALGALLVKRFSERNALVRILTRDAARAAHLQAYNPQVAVGDVRNIESLRTAMEGVDLVIAAAHGFGNDDSVSPATVDHLGNMNVVNAARAAGAAVILMSGVEASAHSKLELFRAKFAAEEFVKASGVSYAIVRATAFVETWAAIMTPPLRKAGRALVFGRGDNRINFVSIIDVAALVDTLTMDATLGQQTFAIGGPASISFNEFAAMLSDSLNLPNDPRHIPRAMLRAMGALLGPFKPSLARHARAAILMDTTDMTFSDSSVRDRFQSVPLTDVKSALSAYFQRER